ncbi:MAG TPA: NADH-quinone oxidoreductase subunit N [Fimbriimonadaceae bacterium]|nr:NADH-quinone oxidoreductase subunit N [Fimbriimonadaceae bacterium]
MPEIYWPALLPILLVTMTGIVALIPEIVRPRRDNMPIVAISLAGLAIAAFTVVMQYGQNPGLNTTFGGMLAIDDFGLTMQLLIIGATFVAILFSEGYLREKRIPFGEFYPLVLWSAVGAMVMSTTTNLLMIFLGVEILSISLYVLAGMSRREEKSEESALKYFLLGAFASAFLLYGIALTYGATGSLDLTYIGHMWFQGEPFTRTLLLFGLGLMLIGLSFKASFVPFHQWTPDVYQGSPTNVTTFMASASKIGAFGALVRVLDGFSSQSAVDSWLPALFWIAILTMVFGNLIAIVQKDVKRILGYSSIAHAGYMLVGIIAHYKDPQDVSLSTLVYYLLSYALMTIGAFAVVSLVAKGGKEGTRLKDLHGLWQRSPLVAGALLLFVASLIGIPPTSGFFGKFMIFNSALTAGLAPLAIVLAATSIISVYYYLGIAVAVFISEEDAEKAQSAKVRPGLGLALALCCAGIIGAVIFISPVMNYLSVK